MVVEISREKEKIITQFEQFTESIDERILEFINSNDNKLTKHISSIHRGLWKNYKKINGTSAGFYGISEYIVFSAFKKFIEKENEPQKFSPKEINNNLCRFELENKNKSKSLTIYRSSSLTHLHPKAKEKLFKKSFLNKVKDKSDKFRAPDVAVLKQEGDNFKLVAVIETKNYLDKGSTDSGIEILKQIQKTVKNDNTKYALFSFNKISVRHGKTIEGLKRFQENKNNFLITNDKDNKKEEFEVVDLLDFFKKIKDEIKL